MSCPSDDFINTMKLPDLIVDEKVYAIDQEWALAAPNELAWYIHLDISIRRPTSKLYCYRQNGTRS